MAPWVIALIFVVALCGIAWLTDRRARRRRRGLTRMNGSISHADRVAEAERLSPGIAQHSADINRYDTGGGWSN
jgi:hypothetical protein